MTAVTRAERIADAVLYEGYVLYPYRASAAKNRIRWPFGVIAPRTWAERDGSERWFAHTECLMTCGDAARLHLRVRWLRVQRRHVETMTASGAFAPVDRLRTRDVDLMPWDEGVPCTVDLEIGPHLVLAHPEDHRVTLPPARDVEILREADGGTSGRVTRVCGALDAAFRVTAERAGSMLRVRVRMENTIDADENASRDAMLPHALTATHVILSVEDGAFVSLLDPPAQARAAAAACVQEGLWPVLVGPEPARDVMLAAPIILYDYPAVAPESPGDLCDATEIDETLTLRILTLTDAEKQEARATDPRARLIVDRTNALPPEVFERLHGAVRSLRPAARAPAGAELFASFELPPGQAPGEASVLVDGVPIGRGSHVVLRPMRRADAMDMFLDGQRATVAGVYADVDGRTHVAVTIDGDPGRDLHDSFGRYFYFGPDEIAAAGTPPAPTDQAHEVTP